MILQTLGRFGRLRKTLSEEKNTINTPTSNETLVFKSNEDEVAASSGTSEDFEQISQVVEWLVICLSEGHIEPSQQCVGMIVGWPLRPFFKNSLWIDFEVWCFKKNFSKRDMIRRESFYHLLDKIFISDGDKYLFPSLEECRKKFTIL